METQANQQRQETEEPRVAKPFVSKAQHLKWIDLLAEGKVTQESFDAKMAVTDFSTLPERVTRT